MIEDYLKDFPFENKRYKKFQKKILKLWRDAYNNFYKLFKHDL